MVLSRPIVCIVTRARGSSGGPERARLLERLAAGAAAGASIIQIRERQLEARDLLGFVAEVQQAVRGTSTLVLVNDRSDIAIAARADGVHLKSDAPPVADVRRILPGGFVVGRSVHSPEEARAISIAGGCDYLLFGTVFPSKSKPDDHPAAGVEALQRVCAVSDVPVVAIGGITEARAAEALAAGAAGIAAISLFAESPDIGATVKALRSL